MSEHWLSLTKIPAEGRDFSFSDQSIWTDAIREFDLDYRIAAPLKAELHVAPQKKGCYIRGRLTGSVEQPCDRCAEPARVELDESFELFETLDPEEEGGDMGPGLLRKEGEVLELNVGALLWEQLLLALPPKPLCREECLGLCAECGQDLNLGPCGCRTDRTDPRLTVLKDLTIDKKTS